MGTGSFDNKIEIKLYMVSRKNVREVSSTGKSDTHLWRARLLPLRHGVHPSRGSAVPTPPCYMHQCLSS